MDEPTVGLHPRDTGKLVDIMHALRSKGNTLVVVEHEEAVIRRADHIVDIGPGRGSDGGTLMFSGPATEFENSRTGFSSLTAARQSTSLNSAASGITIFGTSTLIFRSAVSAA